MKMFSVTEHFNRELTMKMAWDLAIENPNAERLLEIEHKFPVEIRDLVSRVGLTQPEAVAFLYTREAIERTQFEYNKASDAPFMRGHLRKNFLIFFKYTQNYLFAVGYNNATVHMLALMTLMYGLNGLPGSDELKEVFRLIWRKYFGHK